MLYNDFMSDKVKLKELEEFEVEISPEHLNKDLLSKKIKLDNLENTKNEEAFPVQSKTKSPAKKATTRHTISREQYFVSNYDLTTLYVTRSFSLGCVLAGIDLTRYFLRWFDGIDVLSFENYQSLYYTDSAPHLSLLWVIIFLITIYVSVPTKPLYFTAKGILGINQIVKNGLFYSDSVFIKWDDIKVVKLKGPVNFFV